MTVFVVIVTQLMFTSSDLLGRHFMKQQGFHWASFAAWWFVLYMALRTVATMGQLYVFSQLQLGKSMALFGAFSLIMVNILGILILNEVLSLQAYIGIFFAITAIVIIALSK